MLIVFTAFLGFALSYPGKRNYFTLYPMLIFIVMLGGLVQLSAERVQINRKPNVKKDDPRSLLDSPHCDRDGDQRVRRPGEHKDRVRGLGRA